MPSKPRTARLTKRTVDAARPRARRYIIWDRELKGFGLRVEASGTKSFILRYRPGGGRKAPLRQMAIGRFGPLTVEQARIEAREKLGMVAGGADPAHDRIEKRGEMTVSELCDLYMREGIAMKKASTVATDKGRIKRHIKPLLGRYQIGSLRRADIERFMTDIAHGRTAGVYKTGPRGKALVRGGRGTASRTVGLLGAVFTFAVDRDLVAFSPVRGIKRYRDQRNQMYLGLDGLRQLGRVLSELEMEGSCIIGVDCLRLLAMTGARKSEITKLMWSEVDLEHARLCLLDSKTGAKTIPLGRSAVELIDKQVPMEGCVYVFPSERADGATHYQGIEKIWKKVRVKLEMPHLRIHDLRHSFAAVGATHGQSLPIIGAILGHREVSTTQRYAHLADYPVQRAANQISGKISDALMQVDKPELLSNESHSDPERQEILRLIGSLQAMLERG